MIRDLFIFHLLESLCFLACHPTVFSKLVVEQFQPHTHGLTVPPTGKSITIIHIIIMFRHAEEAGVYRLTFVELCGEAMVFFSSQLFFDIPRASEPCNDILPCVFSASSQVSC